MATSPARSRATRAAHRPMVPAPRTITVWSGPTCPRPTPRTATASGSVSDAVTTSTPSGTGARFATAAPAQVRASGGAVLAPPARDVRGDRVAHVGKRGGAVDHRADELVARRSADRAREMAVPEVEIGPADPARIDVKTNPPGFERRWLLVDDVETLVRPHRPSHGSTL